MDKKDYIAALDVLKSRKPDHCMIPEFERGFTPLSAFYLAFALADDHQDIATRSDHRPGPDKDPYIRAKYTRLRSYLSKRAKLSNSFHGCTSDNQRAYISRQIQDLQTTIAELRRQVDRYKSEGIHQADPDRPEDYPVPDDPIARIKKRNSLRSQISKKKRQIERLAAAEDSRGKSKRLAACQMKLSDLNIYLSYVEKAITSSNI